MIHVPRLKHANAAELLLAEAPSYLHSAPNQNKGAGGMEVRIDLAGNHCGLTAVSRNSWADTSTTLPSRQIEIGRPSRICASITFSKAALRAISARSPRGNSRIFAGGLVV